MLIIYFSYIKEIYGEKFSHATGIRKKCKITEENLIMRNHKVNIIFQVRLGLIK